MFVGITSRYHEQRVERWIGLRERDATRRARLVEDHRPRGRIDSTRPSPRRLERRER
jgi:hypothetical protein